jgi:two-component system sensor histidine kinase ChvG
MKTPVLRLISDQGVTSSTLPVYISPLRLAQVLDNLLENALSFNTPEAPITMRVEAVPNQALLVVEDSGPGIPAANLERIFDRFFSYRPSEQHKEHMGLGLSIVKAIIEGYGGIITAANKQASCGQAGCRDLLPAGAVFTIRFPLHT